MGSVMRFIKNVSRGKEKKWGGRKNDKERKRE